MICFRFFLPVAAVSFNLGLHMYMYSRLAPLVSDTNHETSACQTQLACLVFHVLQTKWWVNWRCHNLQFRRTFRLMFSGQAEITEKRWSSVSFVTLLFLCTMFIMFYECKLLVELVTPVQTPSFRDVTQVNIVTLSNHV